MSIQHVCTAMINDPEHIESCNSVFFFILLSSEPLCCLDEHLENRVQTDRMAESEKVMTIKNNNNNERA